MGEIKISRVKTFLELTPTEVYDMACLRCNVFILEQGIVEEAELDGKDTSCYHLFAYDDDVLVGYLRILTEESDCEVWIGRMAVSKLYRKQGVAYNLLQAAIAFIKKHETYQNRSIELSAQLYAKSLYEKVGFIAVGDVYDEVGIEHIHMTYKY